MQIKYISQPHQTKAINSIIDLFQGQIKQDSDYDIFDGEAVCANNISIDSDTILENLKAIQNVNNIEEKSTSLESLDFSIEMETGTGKTFVYIKTIIEILDKVDLKPFIKNSDEYMKLALENFDDTKHNMLIDKGKT